MYLAANVYICGIMKLNLCKIEPPNHVENIGVRES